MQNTTKLTYDQWLTLRKHPTFCRGMVSGASSDKAERDASFTGSNPRLFEFVARGYLDSNLKITPAGEEALALFERNFRK